ncbi:MAG: RNA 2'-phosphotransferase [Ardenticatenales bacterium]|nr:RNA 2'-phosphotransferase [Ardenticatenales bacterium]
MVSERYVRLSKTMSYLLRHRPDEAGLVLDEAGLVPLSEFLGAINKRSGFGWVTEVDIREVVETSDKKRFRLEEGQIGARYGHNREINAVDPGEPVEPPEILYHGTPRRAVALILQQGLQPQGRQFVHLSTGVETAQMVGSRRDERPTLLRIRAGDAHRDGILFYAPTPDTYLAPQIPPEYIIAPEERQT